MVVAAGNHYYQHQSAQGMGFPAIVRQAISVGAVYGRDEPGGYIYRDADKVPQAIAHAARPGQITPFSQRLHRRVNRTCYTTIFAPGAPVTSAGINGPHGESTDHGTSQATPVVAGMILLLQEYYQRHAGESPTVDQLTCWLRRGGVPIRDDDEGRDNVQHTGLSFRRLDAARALSAAERELARRGLLKRA